MSRRGGRSGGTLLVGCGFIGSHIAECLAAEGRATRILTRSDPPGEVVDLLGDADLLIGDAGDRRVIERALSGVETVLYAAGGLLPAAAETRPELHAKLASAPLKALLEAMVVSGARELIYISSGGTVYGEPLRLPVDEAHPTAPRTIYGKEHLACETLVLGSSRSGGLRARILRCATVYGERQTPDRGQGAVVTFLDRVGRGRRIDLYGSRGTIRDYVYAGDVAEVCARLIGLTGGPSILNLSTGVGTSLVELLEVVEAQVGRRARVADLGERPFDIHQIVLDPRRLRDLVPFSATPLREGVARTHRWLGSLALEAA